MKKISLLMSISLLVLINGLAFGIAKTASPTSENFKQTSVGNDYIQFEARDVAISTVNPIVLTVERILAWDALDFTATTNEEITESVITAQINYQWTNGVTLTSDVLTSNSPTTRFRSQRMNLKWFSPSLNEIATVSILVRLTNEGG